MLLFIFIYDKILIVMVFDYLLERTIYVTLTNCYFLTHVSHQNGQGNIVIRDSERYSWSGAAYLSGHIEAHEG